MRPPPTDGYSITLRLRLANKPGVLGVLTSAIGTVGGSIGPTWRRGLLDEPQKFAGELPRQTNDACAKLICDHTGRFGAFATLPLPDVDATL
jgi:hypothetical protein